MLFLLGMFFSVNGQNASDQIFLTNGETIAVKVKKVAPNTITYVYLGEELENEVEKDDVVKIIFKSGREQDFNQSHIEVVVPADFEYPLMNAEQGAA